MGSAAASVGILRHSRGGARNHRSGFVGEPSTRSDPSRRCPGSGWLKNPPKEYRRESEPPQLEGNCEARLDHKLFLNHPGTRRQPALILRAPGPYPRLSGELLQHGPLVDQRTASCGRLRIGFSAIRPGEDASTAARSID